MEQAKKPRGAVVRIIFSVACILIGALLLFVKEIELITLGYVLSSVLIVGGIYLATAFFISGAYKKLNDYRFAAGVLLAVLGLCGLIRASDVADRMEFYVGLSVLVLSSVMLQGAVQMRALGNRGIFIAELVMTALTAAAAVIVLTRLGAITDKVPNFAGAALLAAGFFSLLTLLLSYIGIKAADRRAAEADFETSQGVTDVVPKYTDESGDGENAGGPPEDGEASR